MHLRNWFDNLKTSCGLSWLRTSRRSSPLRKRTFSPCFQAAEVCEERRLLSAGALDPTFGSGGLVSTTVGGFGNAFAVATYPAGTANARKVVAVGTATLTKGTKSYNEFAVVRYNLDGTLDTSFGGTGEVTTILTSVQQSGRARDVAIQPDGKVVVAGEAFPGFALVRYNADGSLDTSFGSKGTGIVVTSIGKNTSDEAYRLGLQTDGRIVVAGTTGTNSTLALVRYTSSGALDSSFGTGGKVTTQFSSPLDFGGPSSTWIDLALDTGSLDPNAGKIVVATRLAQTGLPDVLARYTTNGSLDTSFAGGAGYETLNNLTVVPSVAIQADGRIIVAGNQGGGPMELDRLNTDGTFDATFGSGGIVTVNVANSY